MAAKHSIDLDNLATQDIATGTVSFLTKDQIGKIVLSPIDTRLSIYNVGIYNTRGGKSSTLDQCIVYRSGVALKSATAFYPDNPLK